MFHKAVGKRGGFLKTLDEFESLVQSKRRDWGFKQDDVGGPWYRGQQRKHWKLLPGIFRLGKYDRDTDDEIREEFAVRAPALSRFESFPTTEWDLYFLMQHYGAPTRLLDWTESPIIALYFAIRDNPGHYDSAVWMLDPYELNNRVIRKREVISPSAIGVSSRDQLRAKPWLPPRWSGAKIPDDPLAIFPTHIARRISSQKACFTIHGGLENGFTRLSSGRNACLEKFVIPARYVEKLRFDIQNYGIDDTTIFPDLEGLCRSLTTRYRIEKRTLPHRNVYARLKPSKLKKGAIGVFAISKIKVGTRIFAGENEEICWMHKSSIPKTGSIGALYREFAIVNDGYYGCPVSFNRLAPAWFMSHSKNPNVQCDENYDFIASREILAGEELTVDFLTFSDEPI